jgi:hypothetical protein
LRIVGQAALGILNSYWIDATRGEIGFEHIAIGVCIAI